MKTAAMDIGTALGNLRLTETEGRLSGVSFLKEDCALCEKTPLLEEAARQLSEYFEGNRHTFDLPLWQEGGTPFQQAVWQALATIPYGQTASYGDIARQIGHEKAFRAVGMACHRNPIAIIVPCHRVIGTNGTLTGYAEGLTIKETLLKLEQEGIQHDNAH